MRTVVSTDMRINCYTVLNWAVKAQKGNKMNNKEVIQEVIERNKALKHIFLPWLNVSNGGYTPDKRITGDAKILATNFQAFFNLSYVLDVDSYMNFINFFKDNKKVCSKILKVMDNKRYIEKGHSYIIITPDKNLQEIMFIWILLWAIDLQGKTFYLKWHKFNFNKLSQELEIRKHYEPFKKYDNDGFEIDTNKIDDIGGWAPQTIYFDVVNNPIGYVYSEEEEKLFCKNINNRMLDLMSMNKGMIIQTAQPMPFFEEQIKIGVENLHIFDLRNVMNEEPETVNME